METTAAVERMIDHAETWAAPQLQDGRRVLRVLSDKGTEWVNKTLAASMTRRGVLQTTTKGYTPQANGVAEAAVRQLKSVIRRQLVHAGRGSRTDPLESPEMEAFLHWRDSSRFDSKS